MAAVYLHIGLHKTGTTSLQRFFFHHAEAGSLGDIDYPITPPVRNSRAHHLLAGFAAPDSADKAAALVDRIHSSSADSVVLSSELLSLADPARIGEIIGDEAVIVLYLRRQDDYLESFYREVVKMSHYQGSAAEFARAALDREPVTLVARGKQSVVAAVPIYFTELLSRWTDVFDDVRVRLYGNPREGFDVVDDFRSATGLALPADKPPSVNESFPVKILQFRQSLDHQLSPQQRRQLSPLLWRVSQKFEGPSRTSFLSADLRGEIMQRCEEDNRRLGEMLGSDTVFPKPDPLVDAPLAESLTELEFAEIAGLLVAEMLDDRGSE